MKTQHLGVLGLPGRAAVVPVGFVEPGIGRYLMRGSGDRWIFTISATGDPAQIQPGCPLTEGWYATGTYGRAGGNEAATMPDAALGHLAAECIAYYLLLRDRAGDLEP